MTALKLFTDASVNPQSKIGYGAYLSIPPEPLSFESLKMRVKVKRFDFSVVRHWSSVNLIVYRCSDDTVNPVSA